MDRTTLTLTVELELDDDAFRGVAGDDRGARRSFSGWLGLIAAIDELVAAASASARSHDPESDPDPRGAEAPTC